MEQGFWISMAVFVVIPVFNRRELTSRCLESLVDQTYSDTKVVVVDDGSTDGTGDMVRSRFPSVDLLTGDGNLWWVGSINLGIRHALEHCNEDDFILIINNDLVVHDNYIDALVRVASTTPNLIVGSVETTEADPHRIKSGGIHVNWDTAKVRVINAGRYLDEFPSAYVENVDRLTGRGTLFPSEVFRTAGLYDERHFRQCGDTELPVRAHFKYGYKLAVAYDAVVISSIPRKRHINEAQYYALTDFSEYFFGLRSHFNLVDRFWFAYDVAPNGLWFARYLTLNVLRTTGRFFTRLRYVHR